MKFQLKALAAAMVLAAAVPAQAAMTLGSTGNSSMSLAVFDRVNNVSALFDLGKSYSDFSIVGSSFADSNVDAAGTNFSWDLTTGDYATAWNTFLASASIANLQFAVVGTDNNAGTTAGNKGIISTLNAETVLTVSQTVLIQQLGTWDSYLSAAQAPTGTIYQNHSLVDNGGSVGNSSFANTLQYFGNGQNNRQGSISVGNVGQSLAVFQQVNGTPSTIFANNASFTLTANGALTYVAAVPEADSWAMMLLGLGFMGFAARRKQA
ncbi:MAG: PEP-CTERM sorting domain-containing protein [Methylophilus sp.]|nr:PEP-CTERM sorting domain-containing protein [Methylophilus sp.]